MLKSKFLLFRALTPSRLAIYLLGLFLIGANLYFAIHSVESIYRSHRVLSRSYQETLILSKILSASQDIEAGYRGYLLSGQDVFLQPYHRAHQELPLFLAELDRQLKQNPLKQTLLSQIAALQKNSLVGIAQRKTTAFSAADTQALILSNKQIMDRLRQIIGSLESPRHQFLKLAKESVDRSVQRSYFTLEFASFVNVVLLSFLFYWIWRDASFRERSRSQLFINEARKNNILKASPDGIITLDASHIIVDWNPACERIFKCTKAQLNQVQIGRFFQGSLTDLLTAEAKEYDHYFFRYDGSVFPAKASLQKTSVAGTQWFTLYIEDITQQREDRKKLELALQKSESANLAKNLFLANMSHELRTPLNVILGYTNLLETETYSPEEIAAHLKKINSSGQHLYTMINDLLDLSKIEAGKMLLSPESFAVTPLIRELYAAVLPLTQKNKNILKINCAAELGEIVTDRLKLYQSLLNLLSNAAKFTQQGEIKLEVFLQDHEIVFIVSDTGIGISSAQQAKLFKPFVQADSSTTKNYGGTGLGLALTYDLVSLMQGRLELSSEMGSGSQFKLILPIHASEAL